MNMTTLTLRDFFKCISSSIAITVFCLCFTGCTGGATSPSGPDMPAPDIPGPDIPDPDVPGPDVPDPDVPGPNLPDPDMPTPSSLSIEIDSEQTTRNISDFTNWRVFFDVNEASSFTAKLYINGELYSERKDSLLPWRRSDFPAKGRLGEGSHEFKIVVSDTDGNEASDTVAISVAKFEPKQHPFLLFDSQQLQTLQQKTHPLADFVARWRDRWSNDLPTPTNNGAFFRDFARAFSYLMLAYLKEEDTSKYPAYIDKLEANTQFWAEAKNHITHNNHSGHVEAASSLMNNILALDLMYESIEDSRRERMENILADAVNILREDVSASKGPGLIRAFWPQAKQGALIVWAIYKGDADLFDLFYYGGTDTFDVSGKRLNGQSFSIENHKMPVEGFYNTLYNKYMAGDGSWLQSPGYFAARLGGGRVGKSHAMDVIQHVGIDDHYAHPQFLNTFKWGLTMVFTPFGSHNYFGDTAVGEGGSIWNSLFARAHLFSDELDSNARWLSVLGADNPKKLPIPTTFDKANYLTYILAPDTLTTKAPKAIKSAIWKYSGASFWERNATRESLQGVLYSLGKKGGHTHFDTNSVQLSGFGEMLLMNSGVLYKNYRSDGSIKDGFPGTTPDGGSWKDSWLKNVVVVGNEKANHVDDYGAGVVQSLIGGNIEFATTSAGGALGNALHDRSLFMVHPTSDTLGYFIIADQVRPDNNNDNIYIPFHPNTKENSIRTLQDEESYEATINAIVQSNHDGSEKLNIIYASNPKDVKILSGWKSTDIRGEPVKADYLQSIYLKKNEHDWLQAVTAFIPSDADSGPIPNTNIIDSSLLTGIELTHSSNRVDTFLARKKPQAQTHNQVSFDGDAVFYRLHEDQLLHFMVQNGRSFELGGNEGYGFTATKPVAIEMNKDGAYLGIQEPSEICFNLDGIKQVTAESDNVDSQNIQGSCVNLGEGVYTLRFAY